MSKQIHIFRNVGNPFGNGTYFIPLMGDLNGTSATSEGSNSTPWSVAGVISNLRVDLSAAPGGGITDVFTFRVNGVDTGVTVTLSGAAAVTASDTTHSFSVAPGDQISLKRVHSGGTGASSVVSVSFDFDSTNAGEFGFTVCQRSGSTHGTPSTPLRTSFTGFNVAGWNAAADDIYSYLDVVGAAGTLTRYDVHDYSGGTPGTGNSFTFVLYKNGVKQDGSGGTVDTRVSYSDAGVSTSWTGSLPVSPGDTLFLEQDFTGSPSAWTTPQFSCRFQASTPGQFWMRGPGGSLPNQVNPRFSTVNAFTGVGWSTPESARLSISAVTTFYVTAIYESHINDSNPANTLRYTFDIRLNQATSTTPVRHVDHPDTGSGHRVVMLVVTINPAVGSFTTVTNSDTWGLRSTPTTVPPEVRITQMVVLTMAPNTVICATPSDGEDLCASIDDPVLFASWDPGTGRRWYTEVGGGLDDRAAYYGGWKDDRITDVSEVRRAMASSTYDYEVGNFSIEFADEDYGIRGPMGRYYNNREIEIYAVTPDGRRDEVAPKVIATGFTDADPAFDGQLDAMSVRFTCRDRIGIAMGWTNTGQAKVPRRLLTRITLPGLVADAQGLAAPFWYGRHGSGIQASGIAAIPGWDADETRCGSFDGTFLNNGYADGVLPAPSGYSASAVAGGSMPDQNFYVQVYAVDASGNLGTPYPFCWADGVVAISSPNSSLQVSWTAVPGASRYYAVLGWNFFGVRPTGQFIETTGTSVTFTKSQATNEPVNFDVITPGAQIAGDGLFMYYAVRSKLDANTRSALAQPDAFLRTEPSFPGNKMRTGRIWWQSTGAPEYEVLRRGPGAPDRPYEWMFVIPSGQYDAGVGLHYFDEDWSLTGAIPLGGDTEHPRGRVRPIYTRDVVLSDGDTHREFMVCAGAIRGITDWYYDPGLTAADVEINEDDGTVWRFPKTSPSAWDSMFPTKYRDIVGADGITRRWTPGYGKGPKADAVASGISTLTLNLEGIETSGAGTGTLIEDLHDIALHQLRNVIVTSGEGYLSGLWSQTPQMGFSSICVINEESFSDLKSKRQQQLTGGLIGAGALGANGEQIDVSDALRRLQVSGAFRFMTNRFWQVAVVEDVNEELAEVQLSPTLSDDFDIHVRTFKPMPRLSELQNVFTYSYDRDHVENGWNVEGQQYINQDSIDRWRITRTSEDIEYHYLTDPLLVQFVLMKQARRRGDAPNYITLEGDKCLMSANYDVGRYFPARHWRGMSVSGWSGRPLWIQASTFNPATRRVRLDCMDVAYLVPSGAGGFI
jgi:hypothetical protein